MTKSTMVLDSIPTPPTLEPFRILANDALAELTQTIDVIRTGAEKISSAQSQLRSDRGLIEQQKAELSQRSGDLDTREGAISTESQRLSAEREAFAQRERELADEYGKLDVAKDSLEGDRVLLERDLAKLTEMRTVIDANQSEIEASRRRVDQRENELKSRGTAILEQEETLEQQSGKLEAMRENLSILSSQLERDRQEVAVQRTELISRLGTVTEVSRTTRETAVVEREPELAIVETRVEPSADIAVARMPKIQAVTPAAQPMPGQSESAEERVSVAADDGPQDESADRFRKLRRDAKRRIKGLR